MQLSPGLQRIMAWGMVLIALATVAGMVTLAALGRNIPPALLEALPLEVGAIFGGQLFLGHTEVMASRDQSNAQTMQSLTAHLATVAQTAVTEASPDTGDPAAALRTDPLSGPTPPANAGTSTETP